MRALLALLLLNALLAFDSWWPTPAIVPDHRLSSEFVWAWVALLAFVRWRGVPSPRLLAAAAAGWLLLALGRYLDVTAPALFGRGINLYWDAPQLPRFLWVGAQHVGVLGTASIVAALLALLAALYLLLRGAIGIAARDAAPLALRSRAALALTALGIALALANHAGVRSTWPLVSKPVLPTFWRQGDLLFTAWSPARLQRALPASPAFDSDLGALAGADLTLLFVESYGAVAFDHPAARAALQPGRERLARALHASGRQAVSAFVRSPTFGGASDLAHLSLLSGIDLADPRRHDLLLTTQRPTLLSLLRARGWRTFGLYPALSWDWPERRFYGYDVFIDGPALGWRGPQLGYWWIPDQFALARFEQLHPIGAGEPPRLLFFASITSHFPFSPVPPYQPDWTRVLGPQPFDDAQVARAQAERPNWLDMLPDYLRMIDYDLRWLAGWIERPRVRDEVLVVLGDHQPSANVSGEGATWEVPVHIVASRPELLQRFVAAGFTPGLEPKRPALGAMHELTRVLLRAFSSHGDA